MSAEDEHTDGIFDEDPDSWQSFEQMMEVGKKKKLHTFYKTHDIVRNIEAGYIEHHLEDPRKEKIHFRRAKLYGRGLNGIKTIKTKIAKDNLPSETQFTCNPIQDYESAMKKITDSPYIRIHGLNDMERHMQRYVSVAELRYLIHYECKLDLSIQECAAVVRKYECKSGKGHKACVNFLKFMPLFKRDTSLIRENYHTERNRLEIETEIRKEKRSSKYKFHGYDKIYGPADEDHLAMALQKMEKHCQLYRKKHTRKVPGSEGRQLVP